MPYDWETEPPRKFSIGRVIGILILILLLALLAWFGISKLTKKVPAPTDVVADAVQDTPLEAPLSLLTGNEPAPEFTDVADDNPFAEDIAWLATAHITEGYDEADGTKTFRGEEPVCRQDMAAFLFRMSGSDAYEATAEDLARFIDVDENTPHFNEICWLANQGISAGWQEADGTFTFRGGELVTRQDMAAFLYRLYTVMMGGNAPALTNTASPFADVIVGITPHGEEIIWLYDSGITAGYDEADGSKTFRGEQVVTRQDMAAMLHRLDQYIQANA